MSSEDGDNTSQRDGNGDMLEEEAIVEENIANFIGEEDDDKDEDTPLNSDFEEEEGGKQYVRYKKGSGDIRLGQVFDNIPQFKEVVVDHALKEGHNVKFTRWGSLKYKVRCSIGGLEVVVHSKSIAHLKNEKVVYDQNIQ